MPAETRYRTIYNIYGVFAGPAPANINHFIDRSGVLNNNITTVNGNNYNLIKNVSRVQNADYSVSIDRIDIRGLGRKGNISSEIISDPQVSLNFNYLQVGVLNELRLGFYANYTQTDPYTNSGLAYWTDNFGVCSISGFLTRSNERENNDLAWPMKYRDQRNIFVVAKNGSEDLKATGHAEIDPLAVNYSVYGFGNCYINSYRASASVGSFPQVAVGYLCDNLVFYSSGSGSTIPAIDPNRQRVSGVQFAVPTLTNEPTISALLPGDINLSFYSYPEDSNILAVHGTGSRGTNYNNIYDLGVNFTGAQITNYDISLGFNRRNSKGVGERAPRDKYITFPIYVDFSCGLIFRDGQTGSILDLINKNDNYDFEIKLKNPRSSQAAIQYNFRKAKFQSFGSQISIGSNTLYNLNFRTEIDPDDLSKGFFMSGLLNSIETSHVDAGFLQQEDGFYILQEDDFKIVVNSMSLLY